MASVPNRRNSVEVYLAHEETAEMRHEFYRGEIFAVTGRTPSHSRIGRNLLSLVHNHLQGDGKCEVFGCDQRVFIAAKTMFTCPDVTIACDPQFDRNSLVNPRVVCEVLSESTEGYDRREKFALYRQLPTLEEYILVSQVSPLVERFVIQPDGNWLLTVFKGLEATFEIAAISFQCPIADLYRNVEFPPALPGRTINDLSPEN